MTSNAEHSFKIAPPFDVPGAPRNFTRPTLRSAVVSLNVQGDAALAAVEADFDNACRDGRVGLQSGS